MNKKIIIAGVVALLCSCGSHKHAVKDKETVLPASTSDKKEKKDAEEIDYRGPQWVTNVSRQWTPEKGLLGRHFAIWASHGKYYNLQKNEWEWQRPRLFGTNEDLFTQTIVVPYLMPMLENAGASVFSPRERDW